MGPTEARATLQRLLPPRTDDRAGWAADIHAALATLELPSTPENLCAVLAVTEQESGFRADPAVPGLAAIAWKEIDRRAEAAGAPERHRGVLDRLGRHRPLGETIRAAVPAAEKEHRPSRRNRNL